MDRNSLMQRVEERAFEARIELSALCRRAEISPNAATRWRVMKKAPRVSTIGKLEAQLDQLEREKAA